MKTKKKKSIWRKWQLYLMILPALLYVILFNYKPMYGLIIAFKDYSFRQGILGSPWVGFQQFERLFSSYWFPIILKNTLTLSVLALILGFPASVIIALMLNEVINNRVRKSIQTILFAPHFISTVVVCGMLTLFLSPSSGIINKVIEFFTGNTIFFMQGTTWFKWIYVLSGIWQEAGWGSIIYFAALASVDKEILEAAQMDGASRFQRIIHVNLPALVPTMIIVFILNCGSLLGIGYEKVYLLQNETNLMASEVISTYVYKVGLENNSYSFSTAVGLFNSVVNCIILVAANLISRKASDTSLW
nr:ABC transporter permease subunit [uncultured Acetatifactor sp.]